MVWFTKYQPLLFLEDLCPLFQVTNTMVVLGNKDYTAFQIIDMIKFGVNIICIDRSLFGEEYYTKFNENLEAANEYTKEYDNQYIPVTLAVAIYIEDNIEIDDRIDILVLQGVETIDQFKTFRKEDPKRKELLTLLSITKYIDDAKEIIQLSDGVIIDIDGEEYLCDQLKSHFIKICKEFNKPVFWSSPLINDYVSFEGEIPNAQLWKEQRKILPSVAKCVQKHCDGIVIRDNLKSKNPIATNAIKSIIRMLHWSEKEVNHLEQYLKRSFEIKIPVLQPLAAALAASLSALQLNAAAIVVLTSTGRSARWISCAAPPCPILAVTARKSSARRMNIYRKVIPLYYEKSGFGTWREECGKRVEFGTNFGMKVGLFESGAKLVVLFPSEEELGYCNAIKVVAVPYKCT